MGLNGYFVRLAYFSADMEHAVSVRWLAKQNVKAVATSLMFFGALVHVLFITKVKNPVLINMVINVSPNYVDC